MYYQVEQVLERQEPESEKFYKGRGILICESGEGLYALKEYFGSAQKAEFLYWLGICLEQQGVLCDSMLKNKEGNLITEGVDHVPYTFHHWLRGRECEIRNRIDLTVIVSFLARFHAACGGVEFDGMPGTADSGWKKDLGQEYARHHRDLKHIRRFILKRNNKSDFEQLFLQCYEEFFRQSEEVTCYLERYPELGSGYTTGICHGEMNQHNILLTSGGAAVIHLEHAHVGAQITDLGNLLRKILEKNEWNRQLGLDLIREYSRVRPLSRQDLRGLYYRLAYPEKFWKIANHYYRTRKVWDSGQNYEKLSREIHQNQVRSQFLRALWECCGKDRL